MGGSDKQTTPIIRACVVCLGQGRFVRDDVPDAIDAWCACCRTVSFSFPSVRIL
jgi:hypothetical protein